MPTTNYDIYTRLVIYFRKYDTLLSTCSDVFNVIKLVIILELFKMCIRCKVLNGFKYSFMLNTCASNFIYFIGGI